MEKPPFTPEQLRWLEEHKQPARKHSDAWMSLKKEITDYVNSNYGENPRAYSFDTAIKTMIKFHLGIKNVYQIDENNIDEARQTFELIKANI